MSKVLDFNDTSHSIKLIPRYYPVGAVTFELYNESTKVKTVVTNTYTIVNGLFTLNFDYTFENKQKYQIKLEENSIVFRGKLLITDQNTQEYRLTKDLYFYE
jgi:hypothetical protein